MKKIVSVCMAVLMLFALTACNGQRKIDELEARVSEQAKKLDKLIEDGENLEDANDGLIDELAQMDIEIGALEEVYNSLKAYNIQKQELIERLTAGRFIKVASTWIPADNGSSCLDPSDGGIGAGYRIYSILHNIDNVEIEYYAAVDYAAIYGEPYEDGIAIQGYASIMAISGYVNESGTVEYYDNETEIARVEDFAAKCSYKEDASYGPALLLPCLGEMRIPQELFVDEQGVVKIGWVEYRIENNEYARYGGYSGIKVYYKKIGNYILLNDRSLS